MTASSKAQPGQIAPEAFAALVAALRAELAAAGRLHRESLMSGAVRAEAYTGRSWTAGTVELRDAVALTGYSLNTLRQYACPAGRRHQPYGRFPAPTPDSRTHCRRWVIADLALWAADRNPRKGLPVLTDEQVADILARLDGGATKREAGAAHGVSRWAVRHVRDLDEPGRRREGRTGRTGFTRQNPATETAPTRVLARSSARHRAAVAFVTNLVLAHPGVTGPEAREAAAAAGIVMPWPSRILADARAAALPVILERIVPRSPTGLASPAEVAAAFEVSRLKVAGAIERGEIQAARKGGGGQYRIDPDRLRFRRVKISRRTPAAPVDQDHPDALPLPEG